MKTMEKLKKQAQKPIKPREETRGRKMFDGKPEEEVIALLEEAFAIGATDEMACAHAGISRHALYRYEAKTEGFREQKQLLKEKPKLFALQELMKGIRGNGELALRYLERKMKDEFGLHSTIDQRGAVGTYRISDEEKEEILEIMYKSKEQE